MRLIVISPSENPCRISVAHCLAVHKIMRVQYHNRGEFQRHGRFWWLMECKWICILEDNTRRLLVPLALVFLTTLHIQAQPASSSGSVFDEKGRPVPGVVILDGSRKSTTALSFRSPGKGVLGITDTNGHWSLTNAPERLVFAHPDFIHETVTPTTQAVLLQSGISVRGTVVDNTGQPIEGVRILGGDFPVWTPVDGRFELKNCRPDSLLLVAEAPGYAASWTNIAVRIGVEEFRWMMPRAQPCRFRVIDHSNHPVTDAEITVEQWGAATPWDWHWRTDTNGVAIWRDAPTGEIRFAVMKPGFRSEHNVSVVTGGSEQKVILHQERTVKGIVHDESGHTVESFTVLSLAQQAEASWRTEQPQKKGGEFLLPLPDEVPAILRVDAPGFENDISRRIEANEELVSVEFNLRPLDRLSGFVHDTSNRPVSDAEITWGSSNAPAVLGNAAFVTNSSINVVRTDSSGHFQLELPLQATILFAASVEDGFVAMPIGEFRKTRMLRLQPWGWIEGQVAFNGKPQSNRIVTVTSSEPSNLVLQGNTFTALTDENGRFSFRRVPQGFFNVGQVVRSRLSHAVPVRVKSGLGASALVGGQGTRVIGRLLVPETDPVWEDTTAPAGLRRNDGSGAFYQFEFGQDGTFHVESVPPGKYEVYAHWHEIEADSNREICHGAWQTNVTVLDQAEMDLGTLTWRDPKTFKAQ
jgi:protocatechuate 3,4-dioxygenase beta subunit